MLRSKIKYFPFAIVMLLSPVIWWNIFFTNPVSFLAEWQKAPVYFQNKTGSIYSEKNLKYLDDQRWESLKKGQNSFLSRVYYSKPVILVKEFFDYLTFLSPRSYFVAGNDNTFLPKKVEPLPGLFFPFWGVGVLLCVKNRTLKPILLTLFLGLIPYLTGQRTFPYLFPLFILYLYFTRKGIENIKNFQARLIIILFLIFYETYLIGRTYWFM